MFLKKVFVVLSAAVLLLACTEESNDVLGAERATPENASQHKISECPSIDGTYSLDDTTVSRAKQILIKSSISDKNGVELTDSGSSLNINGKSHKPKDTPKGISYVGTCSKWTLTVDYFDGDKLVGKLKYYQDSIGALIIEKISNSKVFGKSSNERWITEAQKNEQMEVAKKKKSGTGKGSIVKQRSDNAEKERIKNEKLKKALIICDETTSKDGEGICKGMANQDNSFCNNVVTKDAYAVCKILSDKKKDKTVCEGATTKSAYNLCLGIANESNLYCNDITYRDQYYTCKAYFSKQESDCGYTSTKDYYAICRALVTLKK